MKRTRSLTRFEKILIAAVACLSVVLVFALLPHGADEAQDPATEDSGPSEPTPEPTVDLNVDGISLQGRKIIVDAGHGGFDVGTTGVSGRLEKEVNLEIAQKLQKKLEDEGAMVIMTRTTDDALAPTKEEDMATRIQIIEDADADAFVSIHQNEYEGDETMSGPQVFYAYQGTAGKRLAVAMQDMLNGRLEVENPRIPLDVPYDVLKPGSQASCTVECGFFSNPEEEARLQTEEYQDELTDIMRDGLKLFFKREAARNA